MEPNQPTNDETQQPPRTVTMSMQQALEHPAFRNLARGILGTIASGKSNRIVTCEDVHAGDAEWKDECGRSVFADETPAQLAARIGMNTLTFPKDPATPEQPTE